MEKCKIDELISIVIPVYNSNKSLKIISEKIDLIAQLHSINYELIFVNDSKTNQETWQTLTNLSTQKKQIKAINLTRNFGQQAATMCGIKAAKGNFIITMDDDLQHDPEDIPKLLEKRYQHDILISQFSSKKHSYFKRATSHIKELFDRIILKKPKGVQLSAFRLFNRTVANGILQFNSPLPYIPAMMLHVTRDIAGVNVTHQTRLDGKSGYSISSLITLFSFLIINNSSLLLQLISRIGIFSLIASFLYSSFLLGRYFLYGVGLTGWISSVLLILFFGGLQLFAIGIIGNYLIRIINYVEQKPSYYIREIIE